MPIQTNLSDGNLDEKPSVFSVPDHGGEFYTHILERIHDVLKPKTYFEIGTLHGSTLLLSECASVAVDPAFQLELNILGKKPSCFFFQMTSDEFFEKNNLGILLKSEVDFAFLDGLHHFEYLLRDFINIEPYCKFDSLIAIHDCIPTDLYVARRDPTPSERWPSPPHPEWWSGDVWKVLLILKKLRPDLKIYPLDASPTGLVLVTGLDSRNKILKEKYPQLIEEWKDVELGDYGLENFYRDIGVSGTSLIGDAKTLADQFLPFDVTGSSLKD